GRVVDLPPQTTARYVEGTPAMSHTVWRIDRQTSEVPANGTFRIETLAPCVVHWTNDNWCTTHDTGAVDTTVGVWCVDLPSEALIEGADVRFTLFWSSSQRWEGRDYTATVTAPT
ncbi:MAG: glucan 1,4-alpha-glucosidase, partial [Gemmatimonadaceae bacterium]